MAYQDRQRMIALTLPFKSSCTAQALIIFVTDLAAYGVIVMIILYTSSIGIKLVGGLLLGVIIARLFAIGHDACHGSFTTCTFLNKTIGRLAFLPSLTPYSLWEIGHNVVHHGFPNLKGRDPVWTPLSKTEYDALSYWKKSLQRFYRTPIGVGFYYLIELWWKKLMFPSKDHVPARRPIHIVDCSVVTLSFIAHLYMLALASTSRRSAELNCFASILLPFSVWTLLMGFVTFQHHTHPAIPWFDKREEWHDKHPQLTNTAHVIWPRVFNSLLHNIMDHTAHHIDAKIPFYQLPGAQRSLEGAYPDQVVIQQWSVKTFLDCLAICRLYDYDKHTWMDYNGQTTARTRRLPTVGKGCVTATIAPRTTAEI